MSEFLCKSWEEAKSMLRKFREEQGRRSDEVLELWRDYLCDNPKSLGAEEWVIIEQVAIAACDCGDFLLANDCYKSLKIQFPSSMRVSILQGLILEAEESYEKALELYGKLLEKDDTNSLIRKRRVAVLRAQNRSSEAIKELNDYLQKYMSDFEGWLELCDLYLTEMDYSKAAFCMEELLLTHPYNHVVYQKYAEIKYTQGGVENMEISKKYFAHSLKLSPNNMRSFFGLYMASTFLAQKYVNVKAKRDRHMEHAKFAMTNIFNKYQSITESEEDVTKKESNGKTENLLTHLFGNLQINISN